MQASKDTKESIYGNPLVWKHALIAMLTPVEDYNGIYYSHPWKHILLAMLNADFKRHKRIHSWQSTCMKTCFDSDADASWRLQLNVLFSSMKTYFACNAECRLQKTRKNPFMTTHLHENMSLLAMRTEGKRTMVARIQSIFIREC